MIFRAFLAVVFGLVAFVSWAHNDYPMMILAGMFMVAVSPK